MEGLSEGYSHQSVLSGDHKTNALLFVAGDLLLTLRSKTWNAKAKKKTHYHKHELISKLPITPRPRLGQRAVTLAQLWRDLNDWQLI